MKRRDFITKSIGLIAIGSTTGLIGIMKPEVLTSSIKSPNDENLEIINLPNDPELYDDIITLSYTKDSPPILLKTRDLINGTFKEVYINEPGDYQLQYTGEHYGWSFV